MEQPNDTKIDESRVVKQPNRPGVLLEETLCILRFITFFTGILPDWATSRCVQNRGWTRLHYLTVTLILWLFILQSCFEFIQLVIAIMVSGGVLRGFVSNLAWCAAYPVVLWSQIWFLRNRQEITTFLEDWSRLESEFSFKCGLKHVYIAIHISYFVMCSGICVSLALNIFDNTEASFLISHYAIIRETLTLYGTRSYHLIIVFFCVVMIYANNLVPSFFYSHVGSAIQCLERDLLELFDTSKSTNFQVEFGETIRSVIWARFESLSAFVERANKLFGSLIFFNHGVCLFMISTLLYFILSTISGYSVSMDLNASVFNMLGFVFRLSISVSLSARVDSSTVRFRSTLTGLMSQHWTRIPQGDRDILTVFLSRLQNDRVAASPCSLYYITMNFLLSVAGLVVSYVIILLQSK